MNRTPCCWALLALTATGISVGEEALIIASRVTANVPSDSLTAAFRILGGDQAREEERSEALRVAARNADRGGEKIVMRLDPDKNDEWVVRRGALRSIQSLGLTGSRISSVMAWAAARDPEPNVREESVSIIKARGDRVATNLVGRHLVDAFDAQGQPIRPEVQENAVKALRSIGDRRSAEALLTYVFMEVNVAATSNLGLRHQTISSTVPTGNGTVSTAQLPIELPEMNVIKYRGTVVVPALAALRALTGQDFGVDQDRWSRWMRTHPAGDWR